MKCAHCGIENADEAKICVVCGASLTVAEEPEIEAQSAEEERTQQEHEIVQNASGTGDWPFMDAPSEEGLLTTQPSKASPWLIAAVVLLAAALVVVVLILVRRVIVDKTTSMPAQSVTDSSDLGKPGEPSKQEQAELNGSGSEVQSAVAPRYPVTSYHNPALVPEGAMDTQIGNFGDALLSNRQLNYYYWGEYFYLRNAYGSSLQQWISPSTPLDQQAVSDSDPSYTWQDYLLEGAERTLVETLVLVNEAKAAGFTLSEADAAYLEQMQQTLQYSTSVYGYESVDDYLKSSYGPGATEESFLQFLEDSVWASAYAQQLYSQGSYTDEEIAAAYEEGDYAAAGLAQDDTRAVNVRHILLMPGEGESWDAALARAEELLALWKQTPTEEAFATLAGEHSEDPGSVNNGGLYTDVQPGQMVPTFNDWCFDVSREIGDTGIVQTDYGYHIMYFSGRAERPLWMVQVENDLRQEAYVNTVASLAEQYEYTMDYASVVLVTPDELAIQYN